MNDAAQKTGGLGSIPREHAPGGSAGDCAGDPLIAAFKKDVDRTLLIENLRLTFDQRARKMNEFTRALDTLRADRESHRR